MVFSVKKGLQRMKSEKRIEQEVILKASQLGATVFKNDVGFAVTQNGCPISFGLAKGSSDLIGIAPIKITSAMVGKTLGIFLSIEIKKDKQGSYKATKEQKRWLAFVEKNGGIGAVLDNADDLEGLLSTASGSATSCIGTARATS